MTCQPPPFPRISRDLSLQKLALLHRSQNPSPQDFPVRFWFGGAGLFVGAALILYLMSGPHERSNVNQNLTENRAAADVDPAIKPIVPVSAADSQNMPLSTNTSSDGLPVQRNWNFQGDRPPELQARGDMFPNTFEPVERRLKITRPEDPAQTAAPVGFVWNGSLKGDFEVTVGFQNFESMTDKSDGQAPRFEVHMSIGPPDNTMTNSALIG